MGGTIISVVNNKGGIGKTTTTCTLADALGKRKKKVLVIDMDTQCNTTSRLVHDSVTIKKSLLEILDPTHEGFLISGAVYPTNIKNVSIICNDADAANLEPDIIRNAPSSFFRLRDKVRDYALNNFDYIIIDNPPNMGSFVLCSLFSSDCVIVPVDAGSGDSVEGLAKALTLIKDVRDQDGGLDLRFLRLLINRYDARFSVCAAIKSRITEIFGKELMFDTVIPATTAFQKAELMKKTIFTIDKASRGATAFRNLASELMSIVEEGA